MVRKFGSVGLILGVLLYASSVLAQEPTYWGDQVCRNCHRVNEDESLNKYDTYMRTGHKWMLVATNGVEPPADLYPWDVPLPELPEDKTWADIDYIFGNFSSGHGYLVEDGIVLGRGFNYGRCVSCHSTGYSPDGSTNGVDGTWALEGIQCEACHSPQGEHDGSLELAMTCSDCHFSDPQFRMRFNTETLNFYNHPQAEEFSHSPHKNFRSGCGACHDPHKSTVFEDGGVKRYCTVCHDEERHTVEGPMGFLECTDCHMPLVSAGGGGPAHLFKITTEPIAAVDNVYEADGNTYWNQDADGNSFLTLDLACLGCHSEGGGAIPLTLQQAANRALTIHPEIPPVDVKVNDSDEWIVIDAATPLSVDVAMEPGDLEGTPATWYILANTTWGWYYYNTVKGWMPGMYPSLKGYPMQEIEPVNLIDQPVSPGYYTFWFVVMGDDGSMLLDTVSAYVTK